MKINFDTCSSIENCTENRTKKIDIIRDKKAKSKVCFSIKNDFSKQYNLIPFDDCVFQRINNITEKCDFGLAIENKLYYIELKGNDNNKALKQILKTYELTKQCFKNYKYFARVITSKKQKPENLDKITYRQIIKFTENNLKITQNIHTEII
jgi:hypothetical protein